MIGQTLEFLGFVGAVALMVLLLLLIGFICTLAVPARDSDEPVREALREMSEMFGVRR